MPRFLNDEYELIYWRIPDDVDALMDIIISTQSPDFGDAELAAARADVLQLALCLHLHPTPEMVDEFLDYWMHDHNTYFTQENVVASMCDILGLNLPIAQMRILWGAVHSTPLEN